MCTYCESGSSGKYVGNGSVGSRRLLLQICKRVGEASISWV
jgi:hypothetical protein